MRSYLHIFVRNILIRSMEYEDHWTKVDCTKKYLRKIEATNEGTKVLFRLYLVPITANGYPFKRIFKTDRVL